MWLKRIWAKRLKSEYQISILLSSKDYSNRISKPIQSVLRINLQHFIYHNSRSTIEVISPNQQSSFECVSVNVHSCVGHACGGGVRNCATLQLKAQLRRYAPLHLKPALNNGNVYIYRIRAECWFKKPTFGRMVVRYFWAVTQLSTLWERSKS